MKGRISRNRTGGIDFPPDRSILSSKKKGNAIMQTTEKGKSVFSGKAEIYARNRPSYPPALMQWLKGHADFASAADIGAGTGLFTACLLPECGELTAVEPNRDMRAAFQSFLPGIPCLPGTAEKTGLPDHSLSLVSAAQAFHWFDEIRFREECRRILRPEGKLAVIWNNRSQQGFGPAYSEVCRKYCPDFRSGHVGKRTPEEGDRFLRENYFREVEIFRCPNPVPRTEEQFIGDKLSRSYALTASSPDYPAFLRELRAVFRKFAVDGMAVEEYETVVYLGRF